MHDLLFTNLDGTLFRSFRHADDDIPLEYLNGKPCSFVSKNIWSFLSANHLKTDQALDGLPKNYIIPITSRDLNQYCRLTMDTLADQTAGARIRLVHALIANGAILLNHTAPITIDMDWYAQSVDLSSPYAAALQKIHQSINKTYGDTVSNSTCVYPFFLLIQLRSMHLAPTAPIREFLKDQAALYELHYYDFHSKIYLIPPPFTKKMAIRRYIKRFPENHKKLIAAGNSSIDFAMQSEVDKFIKVNSSIYSEPFNDVLCQLFPETWEKWQQKE